MASLSSSSTSIAPSSVSSSSSSSRREAPKGALSSRVVKPEQSLCSYLDKCTTTSKIIIHSTALISGASGATSCGGIGAFGGPVGLAVGAGVGFIGGIGMHYYLLDDMRPPFETIAQYRARPSSPERIAAVATLSAKFPIESDFIDALSGELLLDAVKTPQGRIVSLSALKESLKSTGGLCPYTREPLSLADCRIDYITMGKVKRELARQMGDHSNTEIVRDEADAMGVALEKEADIIFKSADSHLRDALKNGKITRDQYTKEMAALNEYLR